MNIPTPQEVKARRLSLGMTNKQAAAALNVHLSTWQRYEAPKRVSPMTAHMWELFQLLTNTHKTLELVPRMVME